MGQTAFWIALLKIMWINILLSGDNAVVIAMACRGLPRRQRLWGMILGAGAAVARGLYLFQAARGVLSAAVRLGVVGPLEAQALLAAARRTGDEVSAATAGRRPEQAAATSPLLDLWQAHQDRLYSRLFRS
jgi:urease accessory protein UreF